MSIFEKWKQGLQWMKIKDEIGEPPWEYDFLYNLPICEYPKYLKKIFKYRTGEDLPLLKEWSFKSGECIYKINKKKLKTFNQKIQWIKLYGITDLMRDCTDKVKVRDFVKEKIGEEYLKPVLQIIPQKESVIASKSISIQDLRSNPADLNNKTGWTASDFRPRSDNNDINELPRPLRERTSA